MKKIAFLLALQLIIQGIIPVIALGFFYYDQITENGFTADAEPSADNTDTIFNDFPTPDFYVPIPELPTEWYTPQDFELTELPPGWDNLNADGYHLIQPLLVGAGVGEAAALAKLIGWVKKGVTAYGMTESIRTFYEGTGFGNLSVPDLGRPSVESYNHRIRQAYRWNVQEVEQIGRDHLANITPAQLAKWNQIYERAMSQGGSVSLNRSDLALLEMEYLLAHAGRSIQLDLAQIPLEIWNLDRILAEAVVRGQNPADVIPILNQMAENHATGDLRFQVNYLMRIIYTPFNVQGEAPVFRFSLADTFMGSGGDIEIDFSRFEILAQILRFFTFMGFNLALIIVTRNLIKG